MIAIKPHHFVDIVTSLGQGQTEYQPDPYGHALHTVAKEILAHPDIELRMELGADDICRPCRHNINGLCDDTFKASFSPLAPVEKGKYNLMIDQRWCARLGIRQDDRLTARELCLRIRDCAGNMEDIYRENPPDKIADRRANLQKGIAKFVEGREQPVRPNA